MVHKARCRALVVKELERAEGARKGVMLVQGHSDVVSTVGQSMP